MVVVMVSTKVKMEEEPRRENDHSHPTRALSQREEEGNLDTETLG